MKIHYTKADKHLEALANDIAKEDRLSVVSKLPSYCGGVYKVADEDGTLMVLKVVDRRVRKFAIRDEIEDFHPKTREITMVMEGSVLDRLEDCPALPALNWIEPVSRGVSAMLREYIAGTPLMEHVPGTRYSIQAFGCDGTQTRYADVRKKIMAVDSAPLYGAVDAIHGLGYAGLKLSETNIVVGDDNVAYLINPIGPQTVVRGMVLPHVFERKRSMDHAYLNRMFKHP